MTPAMPRSARIDEVDEPRRDAFGRIVGWLKRYLLDEPPAA